MGVKKYGICKNICESYHRPNKSVSLAFYLIDLKLHCILTCAISR